MRSHGLHLSVKDRRRSPQSWAKRSAGGWRRAITASLGLLALSGAAQAADYILQATVKDVDSRPLAGVQVAAGAIQKGTLKDDLQQDVTGTTDAAGKLTLKLSTDASLVGAAVVGEDPGRVHLPVEPIPRLKKGTNEIQFELLSMPDSAWTAAGGSAETKGFFGDIGKGAYPPPAAKQFTVDESPLHLWRAYGGQPGKPVLLVQGLIVTTEHPTPMQVFNQASDLVQALRHAGRDVWVLAFADPFAPVAAQALAVSDAVRIASSEASGAKVDVVGLSLGGVAARYALARDEATGGPSSGKVGVFATVDTPHQGVNIPPGVQAVLWVVVRDLDAPGTSTAGRIATSPGLQNVLYQWVGNKHFDQDNCGVPKDASIQSSPAAHDAFMSELTALNGDGYPHQSRNVAVAASAPQPRPQKVGDLLYHLSVSLDLIFGSIGCSQDYKARAEDVAPGSAFPGGLLPTHFEESAVTVDLATRFDPTFVPLASALDVRGASSPFAATFTAKEGQLTHGAFPDGAVAFLVEQITAVGG